jgi:hypothetical protein
LQREAPRKGGKVIVVLGNHEAMNLLGDNRYTTAGEYAAFADGQSAARRDRVYEPIARNSRPSTRRRIPRSHPSRRAKVDGRSSARLGRAQARLEPVGDLGKWATGNPAIVKIAGTLFVHGGISAEYAKQPLDAVNKRVSAAMAAADESPASVLSDPLGPLWYRGLVAADSEAQAARAAVNPPAPPLTSDQELDAVLLAYGAKRLVIGHTPSLEGSRSRTAESCAHRYRQFAILWRPSAGSRSWVIGWSRTRFHARPDGKEGLMKAWTYLAAMALGARQRQRSRPRPQLRCSQATRRSTSNSGSARRSYPTGQKRRVPQRWSPMASPIR